MLPDSSIDKILEVLSEAGREIMMIYRGNDFNIKIKEDNSPVTMADLASDTIIKNGLSIITPDINIFSEETKDIPFGKRSRWDRLWILDPLDGTKEFIARNDQFCISLALVHEGRAVAGFIHAPVTGESWYSIRSGGSFLVRDGVRQRLPIKISEGPLAINISQSHHTREEADWIERVKIENDIIVSSYGSAIKFCRIAEGTTDLYPKFGQIHEWDIAAGDLIIEEAGGRIIETDSRETPVYNKKDYHQPPFIAFGKRIENWQTFIKKYPV